MLFRVQVGRRQRNQPGVSGFCFSSGERLWHSAQDSRRGKYFSRQQKAADINKNVSSVRGCTKLMCYWSQWTSCPWKEMATISVIICCLRNVCFIYNCSFNCDAFVKCFITFYGNIRGDIHSLSIFTRLNQEAGHNAEHHAELQVKKRNVISVT